MVTTEAGLAGEPATTEGALRGDERLAARLADLREDQAAGQAALRELDERRERLVTSLLRIGGAVQVLEELLGPEQ
jgi:hypothetical protein